MLDKQLLLVLNINELKQICNKFNISYNIYIEKNNKIIKTNEIDHKIIIINNILRFLKNNKIPNITLYKKEIINYEKINNINKNDYIYYGQYKTTNKDILKLMKILTNNKFKFGAISQKIIRLIWKKNKLITYEQFANKWLKENDKGINYEELAYNQFMKNNGNIKEWFENKKKVILLLKKYNIL
jgi:hypothetical protein